MFDTFFPRFARVAAIASFLFIVLLSAVPHAMQPPPPPQPAATQAAPRHAGGEANLVLPDLGSVEFQGINGRSLLLGGLLVCALGLAFGMVIFFQLRNLPVHGSMLEISELIYETCKTYLVTQGKFILLLEVFIGVIMVFYFGVLQHFDALKVSVILLFSLDRHRRELRRRVVRHPGQHLRQLARGVRRPSRACRIRFTRFRSAPA